MDFLEEALPEQMVQDLTDASVEAFQSLELTEASTDEQVIAAIDQFVYSMQQSSEDDEDAFTTEEIEEQVFLLGSLWGNQINKQFGWHWSKISISGLPVEEDSEETEGEESVELIGVVADDGSLVIYPFHYIFSCLEFDIPVHIELSNEMLKESATLPPLDPNKYADMMEFVGMAVDQYDDEDGDDRA